jgi:hypothetical protein
MMVGLSIYVLVGFLLCLQHSCRFYLTNKQVLKYNKYNDIFEDSKWFYFISCLLWIFALDFLIEVKDYNEKPY